MPQKRISESTLRVGENNLLSAVLLIFKTRVVLSIADFN